MDRTIGIVEAETDLDFGASPLAARRLAGRNLLHWTASRSSAAQLLDGVAIVAPTGPLAELAEKNAPPGVPVVVAPQADRLGRFLAAADALAADAVVRLSLQSPLLDGALIDRLVACAAQSSACDYASFCSRRPGAAWRGPLGLAAEWCRVAALHRAERLSRDPQDRHSPTRVLAARPEHFLLRYAVVPEWLDRDDLRFVAACPEDWEHLELIVEALGSEPGDAEGVEWRRVVALLDGQIDLRRRMADLNAVGFPQG